MGFKELFKRTGDEFGDAFIAIVHVISFLLEDISKAFTYKNGKYSYIIGSFIFMMIYAFPALYYVARKDINHYYTLGHYDEEGDYSSDHDWLGFSMTIFLICFLVFLIKEAWEIKKILKYSQKNKNYK